MASKWPNAKSVHECPEFISDQTGNQCARQFSDRDEEIRRPHPLQSLQPPPSESFLSCKPRQNVRTTFHFLTERADDLQIRCLRHNQFRSGTEFDHPDPFPLFEFISRHQPANNATGNRPRDLTDNQPSGLRAGSIEDDRQPFVLPGGLRSQCIQELCLACIECVALLRPSASGSCGH